jgi:hypothetical protein
MLDAFADVQGIGREPMMLQDELGGTSVPALSIGRFTFVSVTQF